MDNSSIQLETHRWLCFRLDCRPCLKRRECATIVRCTVFTLVHVHAHAFQYTLNKPFKIQVKLGKIKWGEQVSTKKQMLSCFVKDTASLSLKCFFLLRKVSVKLCALCVWECENYLRLTYISSVSVGLYMYKAYFWCTKRFLIDNNFIWWCFPKTSPDSIPTEHSWREHKPVRRTKMKPEQELICTSNAFWCMITTEKWSTLINWRL